MNRLIALDAFRGFTIAAMILVNYAVKINFIPAWLLYRKNIFIKL